MASMNTRRSAAAGTIPLDKNYLFLNTKGLCLLCYEECPVQTLEKRRVTTQTSVNFTRLVSRYLGFNIDDVIVSPLKKVGRKCKNDKEQESDKKIDKVGYDLCERCAALAHAFCQVQFQVQFHQMILDRCVRSISEIIKEANKKSAAELFTISEDDEARKTQHKTFTRLTLGGLRSANILRNRLYKRSIHKLSKSFPIIKLKRICKSGDWIPFLNKQGNKDSTKTLPVDSKDVIFASLLGCVVSLWIVLSLSFINPEDYASKVKEEKEKPRKLIPMPLINCDELEIEIKFPVKKTLAPQNTIPPTLVQPVKPPKRRPSSCASSSLMIAQQPNQPPSTFQPVVIHKHPNPMLQNSTISPRSQYQHQPSHGASVDQVGGVGSLKPDPVLPWKPKSAKYPTSIYPVPPTSSPGPSKLPLVSPPSSSATQPIAHPIPHYPHQAHHYPVPPPPTPPTTMFSPASSSSTYCPTYSYPSTSASPSSHLANAPTPLSSTSPDYQQYNNLNSNYNYSYNFTTYNYNSSSTWPSYSTAPVDPAAPVPSTSYSSQMNGGYDPYNTGAHGSGRGGGMSNSAGYDYGYDYNNYVPPNPSISNDYNQQNASNQYNMLQSAGNNMYSDPTGGGGGGYNDSETTSYTTLLPRATSSSNTCTAPIAPVPMDVDTTNTSTSDEPSLTHEDPQSLDSENSSMNGDENMMDTENDGENGNGGQQSPQLLFPEFHWRQQPGTDPPLSCKKPGCTEQFITQAQLQLHLRAHGEFQCSFCHLTFCKAHNLAQHEKMRHCKNTTGIGKNKCPRCDFTSTSQYKYFLHFLTYHLRISLYDKPCQICNKPFVLGTKQINRKNHFKFYHDVEGKEPGSVVTCKGCDAPFLKEAQLRDHKANCTAVESVSSETSLLEEVDEITYNTAVATAGQILI